jgi:tetratricopeptide (TPR) repeat protein
MSWLGKLFGNKTPIADGTTPPAPQDPENDQPDDGLLFGPADALNEEADRLMSVNRPADALSAMDAAIACLHESLAVCQDSPDRGRWLGELYDKQASIKVQLGDIDGANKSLLDSWVTYRSLADRFPQQPHLRCDSAIALQKIARVLMLQGCHANALKFIQDASTIFADLAQQYPDEPNYRRFFGMMTELLSQCMNALGHSDIAAQLQRPTETT